LPREEQVIFASGTEGGPFFAFCSDLGLMKVGDWEELVSPEEPALSALGLWRVTAIGAATALLETEVQ